MSEQIQLQAVVPPDMYGMRLDQVVSKLFPDYSRSRLQGWIKEGEVKVNGQVLRIRDKLNGGEQIVIDAHIDLIKDHQAQDMPLDIVFEDEHILILIKPRDLVVHPAAGHADGTLLNALLHHAPEVALVPRAGIVHRLDRDTTGLMVVAKTIQAQTDLVVQLQNRSMGREYEAVVQGVMIGGGCVDEPMGRHSHHRQKMAVVGVGKEAITHYRVLEKFRNHTHVRLKLETGRTHQIRVHMAHINYPIVGDQLYAGRFRLPKNISEKMRMLLKNFKRQALHAKALQLWHPYTREHCSWEIDLPEDMQGLLAVLKADANKHDYEL